MSDVRKTLHTIVSHEPTCERIADEFVDGIKKWLAEEGTTQSTAAVCISYEELRKILFTVARIARNIPREGRDH